MILRRRLAPLALAAVVGVGALSACQPVLPAGLPEVGQGAVAGEEARPVAPSSAEADIRDAVVALARQQIGTPYGSGSMKPGVAFDCSGLTTWAWKQAGVALPRSSAAQYAGTERIDEDELLPGDLVFYSSAGPNGRVSHVAMYAGHGKIVHARKPGIPLREDSLSTYWTRNLVGYGRVDLGEDALVPDVPEPAAPTTTTTVAN